MADTTRTGSTTLRRALRREVPSTVGLLADAHDFAAMRRYRSFTFDDHTTYLSRDRAPPADPRHQRRPHHRRPLRPARTTPPTAPRRASTPTLPAQPVHRRDRRHRRPRHLHRPALSTSSSPRWSTPPPATPPCAYATALLAGAGPCAECGQDIGRAAYDQATRAVLRLLDRAGPGRHHLVCSLPAGEDHLLAALHTTRGAAPPTSLDSADATEFLTVLAAGLARRSPGGLVLRTTAPGSPTASTAGASTAAASSPSPKRRSSTPTAPTPTRETLPPEPGVTYWPGFDLAPDDGRPAHG